MEGMIQNYILSNEGKVIASNKTLTEWNWVCGHTWLIPDEDHYNFLERNEAEKELIWVQSMHLRKLYVIKENYEKPLRDLLPTNELDIIFGFLGDYTNFEQTIFLKLHPTKWVGSYFCIKLWHLYLVMHKMKTVTYISEPK